MCRKLRRAKMQTMSRRIQGSKKRKGEMKRRWRVSNARDDGWRSGREVTGTAAAMRQQPRVVQAGGGLEC